VDLFSGVGPLALVIARAVPSATVYAVDANPEAFRSLQENVRVNRAGNVRSVFGDAAEFLRGLRDADRIILDLPHGAAAFLPAALRSLRRGGAIHFYGILEAGERESRAADLAALGKTEGRPVTVTGIRSVHAYSATQSMFAFDLSVS
jgi:tRNA (guanine37-N1)-methyltransferase